MTGRDLLITVKREAHLRRFALEVAPGLSLVPVSTDPSHVDDDQVRCLTTWRNRHVRAFLTEFDATPARTRAWLTDGVGRDDTRILFMLVDARGDNRGYAGLAYIDWSTGHGEADAIVKGEELPRGTMKRALAVLLDWAARGLALGELGVRVLGDNPALEFYRRCGFVEERREPLVPEPRDDGIAWRSARDGERGQRELVHLRYRP
jgi:RimJ/RimL family protein N-acetyltransferase